MIQQVDIEGTREKVLKALEGVRPYLNSDGGDVRLHNITDELVVELELLGNCETCEMSNMTMKAGLEQAIRKAAPEVKEVLSVKS